MGSGCAVQLLCWICLFFAGILFIGFFLTLWEAIVTESSFCTRAQLLIGAECATRTRELEDSLMGINKTIRFLRPPSKYDKVIELCDRTEICLKKITCEDGHDFVADVRDTLPACDFFKFYSGEFKECAETLISKTSNYTCLNILFNAKHAIRFNRCDQWRNIQPCVHDAISVECDIQGNSTQLAFRFSEVASDFYRGMNCEPMPPRISTLDIDYEIIDSATD